MENIATTFTNEQINFLRKLKIQDQYNWLDILEKQKKYTGSEMEIIKKIFAENNNKLTIVKTIKDVFNISLFEAKNLYDLHCVLHQ